VNAQNKNLVLRIATALGLLPIVLWLIYMGGAWFAGLIGVAGGLAALELNQMASAAPVLVPEGVPAESRKPRLGAGGVASSLVAFAIPLTRYLPHDPWLTQLTTLKFLLVLLLLIAFLDALFFEMELPRAPLRVGIAVLAPIYCGLSISALGFLRDFPRGGWWIVLALVVTWFNDTGGYFAGRLLGKHKMYPRISPSKTWEGALGGAAATTAGAVLMKIFFIPELPLYGAVIIGLGASLIGPLGDLSESMLKRGFGAKDSGKTLPGHGGMLDRIDALLFVSPFVLFCARHLLSAQ
jgi:phosphatidate cytidylyltransferase